MANISDSKNDDASHQSASVVDELEFDDRTLTDEDRRSNAIGRCHAGLVLSSLIRKFPNTSRGVAKMTNLIPNDLAVFNAAKNVEQYQRLTKIYKDQLFDQIDNKKWPLVVKNYMKLYYVSLQKEIYLTYL